MPGWEFCGDHRYRRSSDWRRSHGGFADRGGRASPDRSLGARRSCAVALSRGRRFFRRAARCWDGFDDTGRETLTFVAGASPHPGPWPEGSHFLLGQMLAEFHDLTRRFKPPPNAIWRDWFGRTLGDSVRLIGHCDLGDWNILAQSGSPIAFIDWEQAGPVDPMVELAQLCWLNAHLFDDDLEERLGLATAEIRARHFRGHRRWIWPWAEPTGPACRHNDPAGAARHRERGDRSADRPRQHRSNAPLGARLAGPQRCVDGSKPRPAVAVSHRRRHQKRSARQSPDLIQIFSCPTTI
jgi:hypothetical protein